MVLLVLASSLLSSSLLEFFRGVGVHLGYRPHSARKLSHEDRPIVSHAVEPIQQAVSSSRLYMGKMAVSMHVGPLESQYFQP